MRSFQVMDLRYTLKCEYTSQSLFFSMKTSAGSKLILSMASILEIFSYSAL